MEIESLMAVIMAIVAAVALVVGPVVTWIIANRGLSLTVHHFKLARTASYIERLNHPSMVKTRAAVDYWLQSSDSDDARIREADANPILHAQILLFLNLFSELGVAFKHRLLDRKMTFDLWSYLVPRYWKSLRFWVRNSQAQGRDIARAFEDLFTEMQKEGRATN